eukprot:CAMPEP_0196825322 /NCGR_PEP_ID=MMETSP1362-20130617/92978_1 /TAXON_ID=163516 /ORGANISM="Leptocylindrus danicus, Strain CCMP1856" /LENGTH=365 /DNA_ID=CAMNT_0042205715 /DNA_START=515 /DNA_END=1612 /DNA_ORIENTATION=-
MKYTTVSLLSILSLTNAENDIFSDWMNSFNKHYPTEAEKEHRRSIFMKNNEKIQAHNSEGISSYKMGHNFFSDMTVEEFLEYNSLDQPLPHREQQPGEERLDKRGNAFSASEDNAVVKERHRGLRRASVTNTEAGNSVTELPASVDWVEAGAVTPIKDQKQCGSCWGFAAIAAVESANILTGTGEVIDASEQELVDCSELNSGCMGGWYDWAWIYMIRTGGVASEEAYPYTASDETCKAADEGVSNIPGSQISSYVLVENYSTSALMEALTLKPVAVAIDASASFQLYQSGVYDGSDCSTTANHAVLAVGYGITEEGEEYWLIKNSWGESFGEDGYVKFARDSTEEHSAGKCGILVWPMYPVNMV